MSFEKVVRDYSFLLVRRLCEMLWGGVAIVDVKAFPTRRREGTPEKHAKVRLRQGFALSSYALCCDTVHFPRTIRSCNERSINMKQGFPRPRKQYFAFAPTLGRIARERQRQINDLNIIRLLLRLVSEKLMLWSLCPHLPRAFSILSPSWRPSCDWQFGANACRIVLLTRHSLVWGRFQREKLPKTSAVRLVVYLMQEFAPTANRSCLSRVPSPRLRDWLLAWLARRLPSGI